ncbi:transporter substrate-binding domain-containing protein [Flavobacterium antarcticum]|uniref:transporter substrate-binding domain-containing protein n=1 Tax=Flavobacterium antarcticum TaxID=271155 RepID=UPI0003F7617B|nr:transporter substrate-binding domain-containing protein [Flavobacterium antarcticum]
MSLFSKSILTLLILFSFSVLSAQSPYDTIKGKEAENFNVGYAGSQPFIVNDDGKWEGISVEIWDLLARENGVDYKVKSYNNVADALKDLNEGKLDAVVGPTSITSDRAELVEFSQPYFQSSLAILSRADDPSFLDRIAPLFTINLLYALFIFLFILSIVGTLLWLAERKASPEQFPHEPLKGIANGMWCAIVTMSTTGYGDIAPVTLMGRIVAGTWMVVSILFATTMVAGIASSLTLSGLGKNTISSAEEFKNKKIAVLNNSPSVDFVKEYDGKVVPVDNIDEAYKLLKGNSVQGVVYDRPQLEYFLKENEDKELTISVADYLKQGYGFAFPLHSDRVSGFNISLLKLKEDGVLRDITVNWLGKDKVAK